jgi:hydrogenase nickel incorporation protein HypB
MCATCGCEAVSTVTLTDLRTDETTEIEPVEAGADHHEHVHADGTRHAHVHDHEHRHPRDEDPRNGDDVSLHPEGLASNRGKSIELEARILARNDAIASRNRAWFGGREILALNLVSSPGSGKTMVLERTIACLRGGRPVFVIEGDQATVNDGKRIREAGAPVVQINTGAGCHLEAEMVRRGIAELKPSVGAILFIENVGNLVCPALFDLGERAKVVLFSATEGEDKPLKYPFMFKAAELVLLNKTDLLPHLDFSMDEALENVSRVNPLARTLPISAKTGEGFDAWLDWIRTQCERTREVAVP